MRATGLRGVLRGARGPRRPRGPHTQTDPLAPRPRNPGRTRRKRLWQTEVADEGGGGSNTPQTRLPATPRIPMTRLFFTTLAACVFASPLSAAEPVDYVRDVKPILRERCYACHGALKQKAKLRLDTVALDDRRRASRAGGRGRRRGREPAPRTGVRPGRRDAHAAGGQAADRRADRDAQGVDRAGGEGAGGREARSRPARSTGRSSRSVRPDGAGVGTAAKPDRRLPRRRVDRNAGSVPPPKPTRPRCCAASTST